MEFLFEDCAGYDFDFVDELQEDQVCPICKGAMRDPVQIVECGHQCCEYCLRRSQRYGRYMYKHIHVFPGYKFLSSFPKNGQSNLVHVLVLVLECKGP